MYWLSSWSFLSLAVQGRTSTSQTESAQAGAQPHCFPWAGHGPVSHTAFSMWTPEQITFPIMNNQTRSSVVTESNYEHKWSNQTQIPPGLIPGFFFYAVIPHCPVATHWVGTITENYVIHLAIKPQAGVQTGAWHIWLHFGLWWHQEHGYMSCLKYGVFQI